MAAKNFIVGEIYTYEDIGFKSSTEYRYKIYNDSKNTIHNTDNLDWHFIPLNEEREGKFKEILD